jgi:hypothetical protein
MREPSDLLHNWVRVGGGCYFYEGFREYLKTFEKAPPPK